MDDICKLSAEELIAAYRGRQLSPVDVMRAILDGVSTMNSQVNAFCAIEETAALAAAAESEARWMRRMPIGLLDGVPVSVKDLLSVRGMPTRFGSKAFERQAESEFDAISVSLIRSSGGIIFGKTTTSEFGHKIITESPLTGITVNAWDATRSSGGSSGGAGAATALGLGSIALGTDGGGSIRIPSCWNGVFGLKPSFKRVPTEPSDVFRLSNVGPMTRTVNDALLTMRVLTARDSRDWEIPVAQEIGKDLGQVNNLADIRIAYSGDLGIAPVDPDVAAAVAAAVEVLEGLGARIRHVSVPPLNGYLESRIHQVQWAARLALVVRGLSDAQREVLDPDTLATADIGEKLPSNVLVDAMAAREILCGRMHRFFDEFDVLICPSFHVSAPKIPGLPETLQSAPPLTSWCNQTMQPAASIPCGVASDGIPVGLQIVGRRFEDSVVLRVARAYELARGPFRMPSAPKIIGPKHT